MKQKHLDFVRTKFNLRISGWDVFFKGRKLGSIYFNDVENEYVIGVYDREDNITEKGDFMNYLRKKELKFKKLEIEKQLEKIKGDFE